MPEIETGQVPAATTEPTQAAGSPATTTTPTSTPETPTNTATPAPTAAPDEETANPALIEKLRKEAASYRTKLRDAEAAVKELDALKQAQMSAEERRDAELKTLQQKAQAADTRQQEFETERQAMRLEVAVLKSITQLRHQDDPVSFVDPDAVLILLDRSDITFDEATGQPKGVTKALTKLAEAKPYLVAARSAPGTGANPGNAPRSATTAPTLDDLRNMTTDQINANWDRIVQANPYRGRSP